MSPASDECLPLDFPEHEVLAAADATFVRRHGDGLVHAAATVFRSAAAAEVAGVMLADEKFVRCFVTSVAAAVEIKSPAELLGPELYGPELVGPELVGPELVGPELVGPELVGPVMSVSASAGAPSAIASSSRAVLAAVEAGTTRSISVDVGVVRCASVVVLLWAARPSGGSGDLGWQRLVETTTRRCTRLVAPS